jgi:hypothetical protein
MDVLSPDQVRAIRLYGQYLHPINTPRTLVGVVQSLCGINAQFTPAMLLSVRARIPGLKVADIEDAIKTQRSLVRTWVMRGTLHLLATPDLGWMVAFLSPILVTKSQARLQELGLSDTIVSRGLELIEVVLKQCDSLTRDELGNELRDRGLALNWEGQALYHLIHQAALASLLCVGPDRGNKDQTYVLMNKWVGKVRPLPENVALAELTYRYLKGYGPATPADFAKWSGLSVTQAKQGWDLFREREPLREVQVDDRVLWMLDEQPEVNFPPVEPVVNLLPAFDTLVLAYADRDLLVPPQFQKRVYHGGQTVPVILVNGVAAGTWGYERKGKHLNVKIDPFANFNDPVKTCILKEVADIGRFLGHLTAITYSH